MRPPAIHFADLTIPGQDDIEAVLQDIHGPEEPGGWPGPAVELVDVIRVLPGGRGGSSVLQVVLQRGAQRVHRVLKIGPVAVLRQEWTTYHALLAGHTTALLAPIEAASANVVAEVPRGPRSLGAVVYRHAGEYAGARDAEVRSLEEIVAEARDDPAAMRLAVDVVRRLFDGTAAALHERTTVHVVPNRLSPKDMRLGPNLTVAVDRRVSPDILAYGSPPVEERERALVRGPELVRRTTSAEHAGALAPGHHVWMFGQVADERTVGIGDATVRLTGAVVPVEVGENVWVYGQVVNHRGLARRDLLEVSVGAVSRAGEWTVDGERYADPLAFLHRVLTSVAPGRVDCVAHGDLNPRNVLVVADRPVVIDFGETKGGLPLTFDFCWLEVALLRDVFANLGFRGIVRLQRALALASALLSFGVDAQEAAAHGRRLLAGLPDDVAFTVLFEIRSCAWAVYRDVRTTRLWWRDHLECLLVVAHWTLKWTEPNQSPGTAMAAGAVASAVTELLTDDGPARFWSASDLATAVEVAAATFPMDGPESVDLAGRLLTSAAAPVDVRTVSARLAVTIGASETGHLIATGSAAHAAYVDLYVDAEPDGAECDDPREPQLAVSLVDGPVAVALVGGPGSGKTSVAAECTYQLVTRVAGRLPGARRPVLLHAADLARSVESTDDVVAALARFVRIRWPEALPTALAFGALHVVIDDLDQVGPAARVRITTWLTDLRTRCPRTPVLVCVRHARDAPPGFVVWRLRPLEIHVARAVLHKSLVPERIAARALDHVIDRESEAVDITVPENLALFRTHHAESNGEGLLSGAVLRRRLRDVPAEAVVAVEELAERMVTAGRSEVAVAEVPSEALLQLSRSGILHSGDGLIRFGRHADRDHLAARALLRRLPVGAPLDIGRWADALRVLVTLDGATASVVARLVCSVAEHAPVLAAEMLCRTVDRPIEVYGDFVADRARELADPEVPETTRRAAGAALRALGAAEALAAAAAVPVARDVALTELGALHRDPRRPGCPASYVEARLRRAVIGVLAAPTTEPGHRTALRVIATNRLHGVELSVATHITADGEWQLVHEAHEVLRRLPVHLTEDVESRYREAIDRRMAAIGAILPNQTSARAVGQLRTERLELLRELPVPRRRVWAVRLRFEFGMPAFADEIFAGLGGGELPWTLLDGPVAPDTWLRLIMAGTSEQRVVGAHRLLADAPDRARELVTDALDRDDLYLSILAAAARHVPSADAERVAMRLLPRVGRDRANGFSCLVEAVLETDPVRGTGLVWTAHRSLAERGEDFRHFWPWRTLASATFRKPEVFDRLLCAGGQDTAAAIYGLSSRRLRRHRGWPFSAEARRAVVAAVPPVEQATRFAEWATTVAQVGAVDALPVLSAAADHAALAAAVSPRGIDSAGVVPRSAAEEVRAAIQHLSDVDPS